MKRYHSLFAIGATLLCSCGEAERQLTTEAEVRQETTRFLSQLKPGKYKVSMTTVHDSSGGSLDEGAVLGPWFKDTDTLTCFGISDLNKLVSATNRPIGSSSLCVISKATIKGGYLRYDTSCISGTDRMFIASDSYYNEAGYDTFSKIKMYFSDKNREDISTNVKGSVRRIGECD